MIYFFAKGFFYAPVEDFLFFFFPAFQHPLERVDIIE